MKQIFIILLCFWGQFGFSQIKIKLIRPQNEHEDYRLVKISDTAYIKLTHKEDMGLWYNQSYDIKLTAPDGKYEVYIDDSLELIAFMKRNLKDGIWTTYFKNGKTQSIKTYKDGKLNGKMIGYYINGKIEFRGIYANDKPVGITTSYYDTGKIYAKNYFDNGVYVKQEIFDEKGKMK